MDVYTAADAVTAAKAPFDPLLAAELQHPAHPDAAFRLLSSRRALQQPQPDSPPSTISSYCPPAKPSAATSNSTAFPAMVITRPRSFGNSNFSVTQPLLRNRTGIENRAPVMLARTAIEYHFRTERIHHRQRRCAAAQQYWQAILLRDGIHVAGTSRRARRKNQRTRPESSWISAPFPNSISINLRHKWLTANAI